MKNNFPSISIIIMKIIEIIWLKLLLVNLISTSFFGGNYDNLNKSIERYFFHAIFWGNSPYKKGWPLVLVHCTMKRSANKDDDGKKPHGRVRRGGNLHVITANGGSFPASMSLKPYYEASLKMTSHYFWNWRPNQSALLLAFFHKDGGHVEFLKKNVR